MSDTRFSLKDHIREHEKEGSQIRGAIRSSATSVYMMYLTKSGKI
jgi:hypothetical protein